MEAATEGRNKRSIDGAERVAPRSKSDFQNRASTPVMRKSQKVRRLNGLRSMRPPPHGDDCRSFSSLPAAGRSNDLRVIRFSILSTGICSPGAGNIAFPPRGSDYHALCPGNDGIGQGPVGARDSEARGSLAARAWPGSRDSLSHDPTCRGESGELLTIEPGGR